MRHHQGALRASLRAEYQVDLARIGEFTLNEVIDFVMWLPPGCALWLALGGPAALTGETKQLQWTNYLLQAVLYRMGGSKGPKPKEPKPPEYDHERRARDVVMSRKVQRWLDRQ